MWAAARLLGTGRLGRSDAQDDFRRHEFGWILGERQPLVRWQRPVNADLANAPGTAHRLPPLLNRRGHSQ